MTRIKTKYKVLALISFMTVFGCNKREHKNIVSGIMTCDNQKILLLDDIETGKSKIFQFGRTAPVFYDYLRLDDIITVYTGGKYLGDDHYYQNSILTSGNFGIDFNKDSVVTRQQRAEYNAIIR